MIHIAVCDDDLHTAALIEQLILDMRHAISEELEVALFYSGESFARELQCGSRYDLVFMDIEMKEMDGIAAGQILREDDRNDGTQLIYISSHEQYHLQLFDVRPSGFIKKPVEPDAFLHKLIPALHKAIRLRLQGQTHFLPVQQKGKERLVPYRDIVYLESSIRRITLVTKESEVQYYGILKEEERKLPPGMFIRIHQSYMVNFYYISEISGKRIRLITGGELPVSEKHSAAVRRAYLRFRGTLQ
jgi:DNA-binding LytR/AlgR family response regulator